MSESPAHRPFPHPANPASGQHRPLWNRSNPTPASPPTPGYPRWDPRHHRWRNAALRIDGRDTVHAIRVADTDSGNQRVAPACHTGHDRADDSQSLQPVYDQPVTCGKCRRYRVAHEQGQPYEPNQQELPFESSTECFAAADDAEDSAP